MLNSPQNPIRINIGLRQFDEWKSKGCRARIIIINLWFILLVCIKMGGNRQQHCFNFSYMALPPSYTNRIFGNEIYVEKSLMYEFDKLF